MTPSGETMREMRDEIHKKNPPELSDDTVAITTEGIVDLYGKITTGVIICWTLLILGGGFVDRQNLWTRCGHYTLILSTWLLRGHLAAGKGRTTKERVRSGRDRWRCIVTTGVSQ
jgi:hypothetical protein